MATKRTIPTVTNLSAATAPEAAPLNSGRAAPVAALNGGTRTAWFLADLVPGTELALTWGMFCWARKHVLENGEVVVVVVRKGSRGFDILSLAEAGAWLKACRRHDKSIIWAVTQSVPQALLDAALADMCAAADEQVAMARAALSAPKPRKASTKVAAPRKARAA